MIKKLDKKDLELLQDRILANHFSNIKYIQAFGKREENADHFLYYDRFSLKTFLQEFNVIRNITKDEKDIDIESRNLVRLRVILKGMAFRPTEIDDVAAKLKVEKISKVNAVSMISKIFFLGNPEKVFIYDSLVKTSIGFKKTSQVTYNQFYDRIVKLTAEHDFKEYILEIKKPLNKKLETIEKWAGYINENEEVRRMRITDTYLFFLGLKGISIY